MTTSTPDARLIPQDHDDFPPPVDEDALKCLFDTRLTSFTATPSSIPPFGGPVTLRWSVREPVGCNVAVRLNGQVVPSSGTREVHPSSTTSYHLGATVRRASKSLGRVTVTVDTDACVTRDVPEALIRSQVRNAVDALDAEAAEISQRSPARVEVDSSGIAIGLRMKIAVNNFPDPDLDVDCTIGLQVRDRRVRAFYRSFSVDLDWPWWVTGLSAGVSKIVEEVVEGRIEDQLKPAILAGLQSQLDRLVDQIPGDFALHSLQLAPNEVRVTACPTGGRTGPFVVPAIKADRQVVLPA